MAQICKFVMNDAYIRYTCMSYEMAQMTQVCNEWCLHVYLMKWHRYVIL